MDFKTFFIKNIVMGFFVAVTCICVGIAVLGMVFDPDLRFGYQGLFSPLIYGAVTILPGLLNYSRHEMSVREAIVRKLLQFVLIELIVFLIVYTGGGLNSVSLVISLALSVFLIYMTVNFVLWVSDKKTAKAFNEALLEMQQGYKKEKYE